jgi:hypothetical protein
MTEFNSPHRRAVAAMMRRPAVTATLMAAAAAYAELQRLGRTYGATRDERRRELPGDRCCLRPQAITTHAITINAPPEHVWPWLVQMGWGRGGWYTARWVDTLLFPDNGPSADRLIPAWQRLKVGDRVLDGPAEKNCAFVVCELEPRRHLVLHSRQHLPPGFEQRFGASIDWTWAFTLDPLPNHRTRFIVRSRLRLQPRWVEAFYLAVIIPADFVMGRQMLHGVKRRAEATTSADLASFGATTRGDDEGGGCKPRSDVRSRAEDMCRSASAGMRSGGPGDAVT